MTKIIMTKHLPPRALALIKEYSKPLTRPNWRTLQRMTLDKFYYSLRLSAFHKGMIYNPNFTNEKIAKISKLLQLFDKTTKNTINGHCKSYIYQDCFVLSDNEICIKYDIDIKILNVIRSFRI